MCLDLHDWSESDRSVDFLNRWSSSAIIGRSTSILVRVLTALVIRLASIWVVSTIGWLIVSSWLSWLMI